jgi:hypothetical protein
MFCITIWYAIRWYRLSPRDMSHDSGVVVKIDSYPFSEAITHTHTNTHTETYFPGIGTGQLLENLQPIHKQSMSGLIFYVLSNWDMISLGTLALHSARGLLHSLWGIGARVTRRKCQLTYREVLSSGDQHHWDTTAEWVISSGRGRVMCTAGSPSSFQ